MNDPPHSENCAAPAGRAHGTTISISSCGVRGRLYYKATNSDLSEMLLYVPNSQSAPKLAPTQGTAGK
jgi:hypothetical protein